MKLLSQKQDRKERKGKKTGKITTDKVILILSQTHLLNVIINYNACFLTCNNKNGC